MQTLTMPWRKALADNANTSAFTAKAATLTEPTGDGIVALGSSPGPGGLVWERVILLPYGLGDDDNVFSLRIIGWRRLGSGPSPGTLWIPTTLVEMVCTLSTSVGVATAPILNTERFADTLALVALMEPTTAADVTRAGITELFSPANNTPAHAVVNTRGCEKLEFLFDQTTGTPTGNCLIAFF